MSLYRATLMLFMITLLPEMYLSQSVSDPELSATARNRTTELIAQLTGTRCLAFRKFTRFNVTFASLVDLINTNQSHRATLAQILDMGGNELERKRQALLAVCLWRAFPDQLNNARDLFLRLLLSPIGTEIPFVIIQSMSPSALSSTIDDDHTVFDHYITRWKSRCDPIRDLLLQMSSDDDIHRYRLRLMKEFSPTIWAGLFHHYNMKLLAEQFPNFNAFCESFLCPDDPNHQLIKSAMTMHRLVCSRDLKEASEILDSVDMSILLLDCKVLFQGDISHTHLRAIYRLVDYCDRSEELQKLVLDQIPFLSSMTSSFELFKTLAENRFVSRTWQLKLMKHWILVHFENGLLFIGHLPWRHSDFNIFKDLAFSMVPDLEVSDAEEDGHLPLLLKICIDVRDNPEHKILSAMVVGLMFNELLEFKDPNIRMLLLKQLPNLSDHQLHCGLTIASMSDSFYSNMRTLSEETPALYERFSQIIPTKLIQSGNPDQIRDFSVKQRRTLSNIDDDYEMLAELGSGVCGIVYRARVRRSPDIEVAIKVAACGNLENDIAFMSRFCHWNQVPGLIQLLDLVRIGGCDYIVMELVQGHALCDWPIPDSVADAADGLIAIVYQIMFIMTQIEIVGWSHNDLHCENFLIESSTQKLFLIDFGFARPGPAQRSDFRFNPEFGKVFDMITDLLSRVKHHCNLVWYEPSPGLLGEFEDALKRMTSATWTFQDVVNDHIFDSVRTRFNGAPSVKYLNYPDMQTRNSAPTIGADSETKPPLDSSYTGGRTAQSKTAENSTQPESDLGKVKVVAFCSALGAGIIAIAAILVYQHIQERRGLRAISTGSLQSASV